MKIIKCFGLAVGGAFFGSSQKKGHSGKVLGYRGLSTECPMLANIHVNPVPILMQKTIPLLKGLS